MTPLQTAETAVDDGEYEVPFRVDIGYAGWRLDRYLADRLKRLSRTKVQELIRERLLHDEPRQLKPSTIVWAGLEFRLKRRREPEPDGPRDFGIVYEDEDMLVVDKPAGLAIHPSARYYMNTLTTLLRERQPDGEKWDIAHRLDRETSGIVVCGKRPEVSRKLKMSFERAGTILKEYLAIVHGWPEADRDIDLPLALLDHPMRLKMGVLPEPEGKPSLTGLRVERRFEADVPWRGPRLSLVRCFPRTGRQHQIRVHMAAVDHPIVGDKIYGPSDGYFIDYADGVLSAEARAALVLPRHALHAAAITLPHPSDGRALRVEAPLPPDMQALLDGTCPAAWKESWPTTS